MAANFGGALRGAGAGIVSPHGRAHKGPVNAFHGVARGDFLRGDEFVCFSGLWRAATARGEGFGLLAQLSFPSR
jgi:hypothetical protein